MIRPRPYSDLGQPVYQNEGEKLVEVSLPHILQVDIFQPAPKVFFTVKVFGANTNYRASNFGNNVNVTINYISGNPLVKFTYGELLGSLFTQPMLIGITRIDATDTFQAQEQINITYNPGVSKFDGEGLFPIVYNNQFVSTIAYIEKEYMVDNNILLTYQHFGQSNPSIQLRFYQNANLSLDRPFSNEHTIKKYARPITGITQKDQIVIPHETLINMRQASLL